MKTELEQAKGYIDRAVASFTADPADSDFQRGYLLALETVRNEAFSGAYRATSFAVPGDAAAPRRGNYEDRHPNDDPAATPITVERGITATEARIIEKALLDSGTPLYEPAATPPNLLKYANHLTNCRYRGGHDCDCGLDEIRAAFTRPTHGGCGETDCTFQDGWCKCGMEG